MMSINSWEENTPLCCCEYIDSDRKRNHILACCCNCYELDACCDKMIRCQVVSMSHLQSIILQIQDRIRIPWRGGAKQISFGAILPIIILPALLALACLGIWYTIISGAIITALIITILKIHLRTNSNTKFFVMWTVMSILAIWFIFEYMVQPQLEITKEENVAFTIMFIGAIVCIHILRSNADHEVVTPYGELGTHIDLGENGMDDGQCVSCKAEKFPRSVHCFVCQTCVSHQDYHCVWFDCCIGKSNRRLFILFLLLEIGALSFGSNLTLTTVCNHFVFYKTILLPNDCREVYDQFDLALCFISGVYSLGITLVLLWYLLQQCLFISLGISGNEWRRLSAQNGYVLCLKQRPYSQGVLRNWIHFILGKY